jgi:hypothetical protein
MARARSLGGNNLHLQLDFRAMVNKTFLSAGCQVRADV